MKDPFRISPFCATRAKLLLLISIIFAACEDNEVEYTAPSKIVGKSTDLSSCTPSFLATFNAEILDGNLLSIQNVSDEFFELNTNGDSVLHVLITNEKDYQRFIGVRDARQRPVIDFSKYWLLGTELNSSNCVIIDKQAFATGCDGLTLVTTVWTGSCEQTDSDLRRFVVVDKDQPYHFAEIYTSGAHDSLFGQVLRDNSCLNGITADISLEVIAGASLRNISDRDITSHGVRLTPESPLLLFIVIRNEMDYKKYIQMPIGVTRPSFDFSRATIAGYSTHYGNCADLNYLSAERSCNGLVLTGSVLAKYDTDGCKDPSSFSIFSKTDLPLSFALK